MLFTRLTNDTIATPSIVLAVAQFPIYGAIIGQSSIDREKQAATAALITLLHTTGAAGALFLLPNFS
jgi:hypothetical protein